VQHIEILEIEQSQGLKIRITGYQRTKLPKEDNPLLLPLIEEETDEAEEEKVVVADETPRPAVEETEQDDSCFTETLAKIYIKQRRYDKALEIIKKLSLNYPKKNAYFADQIRFLEKLIINAKSK
jgi:thioredoxin-like negative regulator of GroEL